MNKANLLKILKAFRRLKIPFALAGGHAVAAWGVVRATRDIDFLAAVSHERIIELVKELKKAGFKADYRIGDEGDPVRGVIGLEAAKGAETDPVEIILGIKKMPSGIFDMLFGIWCLGFGFLSLPRTV